MTAKLLQAIANLAGVNAFDVDKFLKAAKSHGYQLQRTSNPQGDRHAAPSSAPRSRRGRRKQDEAKPHSPNGTKQLVN